MKLKFMGSYNGDETTLPTKEHPEGYKMFKEPDSKKFMLVANGISLAITVVALVVCILMLDRPLYELNYFAICLACIAPMVVIVPHELLHALCFKDEVMMYSYLKAGAMFVLGLEDMSKARFTFMSLLPNIVFGAIPFLVFLFFPNLYVLGIFGALNLGAGAGDYLNVFNALTQVPKGGKIYMSGFHSFWYMPASEEI